MFNLFYFKNFVFIFTVTATTLNPELVSIYFFYLSDTLNKTHEEQVTVRYMQVECPLIVQFLQVIDFRQTSEVELL